MQTLSTLWLLLALHAQLPLTAVEGSYVAQTLNGRPVPTDLRVPTQDGDARLFSLEEGVLRLAAGHRFTLHFRYHHQLVRRGAKPVATPVMSESESGTYTIERGTIVLTPAKRDRSRQRPSITATITGNEIRARYVLQDGIIRQPITLQLRRDESYW